MSFRAGGKPELNYFKGDHLHASAQSQYQPTS